MLLTRDYSVLQCLNSYYYSLNISPSIHPSIHAINVLQSQLSESNRLSRDSREGSRRLSKSSQDAVTYPAELPHPPSKPCAQTFITQRSSSYTQQFSNEEYTYPSDTAEEPVATLVDIPDGPPPAYTDKPESSPVDRPKSRKLDDLVSRFNLLQKKN